MKIVVGLLALFSTLTAENYHNCFKRVSRRAIGNYAPIAEYRRTALSMCSQHCIMAAGNGPNGGSICKAFTYEVEKQLCKLFDNDGHRIPAVIHPIIGIDIFYRKSDSNECAGPIKNNNLNPNFVVLSGSRGENGRKVQKNVFMTPGFDVATRTDQFMSKARALSSPIQKMDHLDDVLRSKLRGEDELVPMSVIKERREFEKIDGPLKCRITSGYYVVVGNEIVLPINGGDVKVYNEVEQGDCAKYCSQNRGPDGAMINCRSLNYFPTTQKCELYGILAEPHGSGKLMENENVIYAEKFCLPETLYTCQNDEIFILHVQKTIQHETIDEKEASSITDCLRLCMNDDDCQSSEFVSNSKQCRLFNVNASSGDYLINSEEESVLIENGCRRPGFKPKKIKQKESIVDTDDDWSECNFKINEKRVRVRMSDSGEMLTKEC